VDSANKKIITMSFVALAFIIWLIAGVLLDTLAATFGFVRRATDSDLVRHGVPVGLAMLTFAILQFNPSILTWADEVVVEIKKVVWPSRRDTSAMTTVVCIMLIFFGCRAWNF